MLCNECRSSSSYELSLHSHLAESQSVRLRPVPCMLYTIQQWHSILRSGSSVLAVLLGGLMGEPATVRSAIWPWIYAAGLVLLLLVHVLPAAAAYLANDDDVFAGNHPVRLSSVRPEAWLYWGGVPDTAMTRRRWAVLLCYCDIGETADRPTTLYEWQPRVSNYRLWTVGGLD